MFCYKCGTQVDSNSEFCSKCGAKLIPESAYAEAAELQRNAHIGTEKSEETPAAKISNAPRSQFGRKETYNGGLSTDSLLNRAYLFLEDKDWERAYEYGENALDVDARCPEAYLVKFMAEYNIPTEEDIPGYCAEMMEITDSLLQLSNYKKAHRFGGENFKKKLEDYSAKAVYILADRLLAQADSEKDIETAKALFERIPEYEDAAGKAEKTTAKYAELAYSRACSLMENASTAAELTQAMEAFLKMGDYSDAAERAEKCRHNAENFKQRHEEKDYQEACRLMGNIDCSADIEKAARIFGSMRGYKNSADMEDNAKDILEYSENNAVYKRAVTCELKGTPEALEQAIALYRTIPDWKDAAERLNICKREGRITAENKLKKLYVFAVAGVAVIVIAALALLIVSLS